MKRRLQVWFANFLQNRVDRLLSDLPIQTIIADRANVHVREAVAGYNIGAEVRKCADQRINDDCDVCAIVEARINDIELSDHIDYGQLASEVDYDDLHERLQYSQLASEIDYDDLQRELDYSELANRVDCDDIATHLRESLTFVVTVK